MSWKSLLSSVTPSPVKLSNLRSVTACHDEKLTSLYVGWSLCCELQRRFNGCSDLKLSICPKPQRTGATTSSSQFLLLTYHADTAYNTYTLKAQNVGCFIDNISVGVLYCLDDVTSFALSIDAIHKLLEICKECAADRAVVFNAAKSKPKLCWSHIVKKVYTIR